MARVRRAIIGVGNLYRQDDSAGIIAARRLTANDQLSAEIVESSGEGADLLELMRDRDEVLIIDAVSSGQTPGFVHRFDIRSQSIPSDTLPGSSHAFGVAEALEMARALGTLPSTCRVYGIEGKSFKFGTELSPGVAGAIDQVVDELTCQFAR